MEANQTGLFSQDTSNVLDMSSLSVGNFFDQHIVPTSQKFEQTVLIEPPEAAQPSSRRDLTDLQRIRPNPPSRMTEWGEQSQEPTPQNFPPRNSGDSDLPSGRFDQDSGGLLPNKDGSDGEPSYRDAQRDFLAPKEGSASSPSRSEGEFLQKRPSKRGNLSSFVKQFEGWNSKPFDDYKQVSIGYGTRAKKGEKSISRAEGERRLGQELAKSREHVTSYLKKKGYNLNQNQVDALTSFSYNVGSINQLTDNGTRTPAQISAKMTEYNKAGGKVLKGLSRRRKEEQKLFNQ